MRLFASLYLDEDVSAMVATLLQIRGLDVTTARDQDLLGRDDAAQLEYAVSCERCLFTHNRIHFEQGHREYLASDLSHCGIIIGSRRSPHELARRLAVLLNALTADEITGQLLYL